MAPKTNGTVKAGFEQHQRAVVDTFARAALAMRDAAKVAEEFSNWFARVNNIKDIPSPSFEIGSTVSPPPVVGKKRKADKDAASPVDEGGKKKRAVRKPRDKDAPKQPPSAYLLFQNEVRKEIKNEHPTMNHLDLLREVSKLWTTVSEKEKGMYVERHKALRTKYDEEKAAYDAKQVVISGEKEETPKKPTKKEPKITTLKENTSNASGRTKPHVSDDSDPESPKDEEDELEQQEQELEAGTSEEEVVEEEEEEEEEEGDQVEDSEAESESESEPEPPKKKAKVDGVYSDLHKGISAAKKK